MSEAPDKSATANLQLLLVEASAEAVERIVARLEEAVAAAVDIVQTSLLAEALQHVSQNRFDCILLDLDLPDSKGLDALRRLVALVPDVPVIVLGQAEDEQDAADPVREGAQDFLILGRFDGHGLLRAIHYAIERSRMQAHIRRQDDELSKYKSLLLICSSCHKVRLEGGEWQTFEAFLHEHHAAHVRELTCPDCTRAFASQMKLRHF